ncbi:MAG: aldehyde dehydrogenase [Bacillus thermozeamaize]|mgnify:CR=1 FL=1|uniref:Aldehyde dehydrogenase n=1 Tax=Bacillus thermozeamaize TaxID=230954 RepID=A0A1Y3PJV3_9BACI|nr:MAG: aldehyde dehydrogenase [Bacillus thermozeamaize]
MERKKMFVGGRWIETEKYKPLIAPYSKEVIAEIPEADESHVEEAIESARRASAVMAEMPAHQRSAILGRLVSLLEQRVEEAARIIALEAAKPITTAKTEVARTIQTYRFSAEEAKRIGGETIPMDAAPMGENRIAYTVREPLGVIGAITPFNFPMNLVAHKVGPALASGNAVVLKPARQTPLSAFFIAELLEEAGLPPGALNVVTGAGSVVGDRIVTDPRVSMITFTGSPEVGKDIRARAGLKRVTLELGSNSAVIVDEDADLQKAIPRCVTGAFSNQGQICISVQRIYVHEAIYDRFVDEFVVATRRLRMGDPLDPATDVSALISENDLKRCLEWIEEAKASGAVIATGGKAEGPILEPTIILNADPSLRVSCREVFGPVVTIDKVGSVEEAIERTNDSRYGLQAGIYTGRVDRALMAAKRLRVGGVMINDIPTFRVDHMPYGGVKESGMGREGVKYAIEEMTELKLVVWNSN